jgi:hypothetical protein
MGGYQQVAFFDSGTNIDEIPPGFILAFQNCIQNACIINTLEMGENRGFHVF